MIGRSIYLRDRDAFQGGSPQAVYEELWQQDRKSRLRTRAALAGAALLIGGYLITPVAGVLLGLLVAGADALHHWWRRYSITVWRRGLRGEEQTSRLLRYTVERKGYRVLHERTVPGYGNVDQLLIGPGGDVFLVDNHAYGPDTEITAYGGKLFVDDKTPSQLVTRLTGAAAEVSRLLTARLDNGRKVPVTPLLVVRGGRLRRGRLTADGITVLRPLKLLRLLNRNQTADPSPEEQEELMRAAVQMLPIGGRSMNLAA